MIKKPKEVPANNGCIVEDIELVVIRVGPGLELIEQTPDKATFCSVHQRVGFLNFEGRNLVIGKEFRELILRQTDIPQETCSAEIGK